MANHVSGSSTLLSLPPPSLDELRQHVLLPLISHPLSSEAEQLRATHFVHESDDITRLTRWGASVRAEITNREAAAARVYRQQYLRVLLPQLRPTHFRGHGSALPDPSPTNSLPRLVQPDRRAGIFDRRAAARFQPADSLSLATLRSRCAQ